MSYLVLARKFRPQDFGSVSGQEHVTRPLANAIKRNLISHAFLFCGPRGVGKTTVARVLAKSLNCKNGPTDKPCLECANCKEIAEGRNLAVREIDGASHNSVENVRDLIDTLRSQPPPGSKYKVYIIDEVHMLSVAAFNALLKNLEEPPPHTVFVLATTDPQKIPETVMSRCQRYDFRSMSIETIEAKLKEIAKSEKIDVEPEVFAMIARLADGSMRDAQSFLDRVRTLSDGKITAADASQALGVVSRSLFMALSRSVFEHNSAESLNLIGQAFSSGLDPRLFVNELAAHWRELLIAKFAGVNGLTKIGLSEDARKELLEQVASVSGADLQDLLYLAQTGCEQAVRSLNPRISLEALAVRMATREPVHEIAQVLGALKKKELSRPVRHVEPRQVANGAPVVANIKAVEPIIRNASDLNWRDFVDHVQKTERSAMPECLKRLTVQKFEPGVLKVIAPKLAQEYFGDKDNKGRLVDFLNGYFKSPTWDISLSPLDPKNIQHSAGSSLVDDERREISSKKTKKRESATVHPAVQNIKKFFPGTTFDS